jgi:hypothetical protein
MATVHPAWFGVVIELNHPETIQVVNAMNMGANSAQAVLTALFAHGVNGPGVAVASAAAAILRIGSGAITGCNSKRNGVFIYILWVGAPWCRPR